MKKFGVALLLIVLLASMAGSVSAATPPDIIHSYVVTVMPQPDGSLQMKYEFDYEATTDFPRDIQYLEVGVPNKDFTITEFGGDLVTKATPKTSGGSWVHSDFKRLLVKGDRFKLNFTIVQRQMAFPKGDEVTFKFVPGWFDFATIELLRIVWMMPENSEQIHALDPQPTGRDGGKAVWEVKNLPVNGKTTVNLVYDKAAFPEMKTVETGSPSVAPAESEIGWLVVIMIIVGVFLAIVLALWLSGAFDDSYDSGGYVGGTYTPRGYDGGYYGRTSPRQKSDDDDDSPRTTASPRPTYSPSPTPRSSGGGGSYSGRSSSCACVSACACACACAGGGRVGCGKKLGVDIHAMLCRKQ